MSRCVGRASTHHSSDAARGYYAVQIFFAWHSAHDDLPLLLASAIPSWPRSSRRELFPLFHASGAADISSNRDPIEQTVSEVRARGVEFTQKIEGHGLVSLFEAPGFRVTSWCNASNPATPNRARLAARQRNLCASAQAVHGNLGMPLLSNLGVTQ